MPNADRPEVLCQPCRGSGVCPRCNPKGEVRAAGQVVKCLSCNATTVCRTCRGRGWVLLPRPEPEPSR